MSMMMTRRSFAGLALRRQMKSVLRSSSYCRLPGAAASQASQASAASASAAARLRQGRINHQLASCLISATRA